LDFNDQDYTSDESVSATTKEILFSNGKHIAMTLDEVLTHFEKSLQRFMYNQNLHHFTNPSDNEDILQELRVHLWIAFQKYDPDRNVCFSTFLFYQLKCGYRDAVYKKYAQKRHAEQGVVYLNNELATGKQVSFEIPAEVVPDNTFATPEQSLMNKELESLLQDAVTDDNADMMLSIIDRQNHSVVEYAEKHDCTRQNANKKIRRFKQKLQKKVETEYMSI
jgi:RNA polymerase sigma factor (sigma-70 family)